MSAAQAAPSRGRMVVETVRAASSAFLARSQTCSMSSSPGLPRQHARAEAAARSSPRRSSSLYFFASGAGLSDIARHGRRIEGIGFFTRRRIREEKADVNVPAPDARRGRQGPDAVFEGRVAPQPLHVQFEISAR